MNDEASPPFRCADAARERGDPPWGTAPQTSRWLLIERHGPWPVNALAGTGWPPELLRRLDVESYRVGGRVLLIRRPGRADRARAERSWAVVDGGRGVLWGRWREPADLHVAVDALVGAVVPSTDEPLLLVCSHGVHDVCCALRGRPVAAALEAARPGAVWECSHLGGDRFAANLIVLPDGAYYGNLDAASAPGVVAEHLAGRLDLAHLRGVARHPPVVQVAVAEAHRRFGPYATHDVGVTSATERPAGTWTVGLALPGGTAAEVVVVTGHRPPAQLTCRASRETSATSYAIHSVTST